MCAQTESSADSNPLVSVVIPTYRRNENLPHAVESVANQSYGNIELLIVDDGSPTPITETLTHVPDDRLTRVNFIRHSTNRGANVARNSGIRAATGEYIAFLDDDDWWDEEKVKKQVDTFTHAGSDVAVVYTGLRASGPNGTTVTHPSAEGDVLGDLLRGVNFGQFSSVMVRATAIDDAGLPDERFPAWQDREWLFRLAQHGEFKPVREVLTYRQTGGENSISSNFEAKRDVAYPMFIDKHYSLAREHGWYSARLFTASLRHILGRSAIQSGNYTEARKHFLLSFLANPLYKPVYPHLLASLGGKQSYESVAFLRRKLVSLCSVFR